MPLLIAAKKKRDFDPKKFLAIIGEGRKVVAFPKKQTIFTQGDAADAVFYLQKGRVRLTVVSEIGKEATLGILNEGDLFGEGCLAVGIKRSLGFFLPDSRISSRSIGAVPFVLISPPPIATIVFCSRITLASNQFCTSRDHGSNRVAENARRQSQKKF